MKSLKVQDALSQAMSIALDAADATIEAEGIDWTRNPESDRERDIRRAIIRRVESEAAESDGLFDECRVAGERHVASQTLSALEDLAPRYAEIIGADLYDAIERWEVAYNEERKRNDEIERKRLFDRARCDIDART